MSAFLPEQELEEAFDVAMVQFDAIAGVWQDAGLERRNRSGLALESDG
jgi:hypothetical protein